MKHLLTILLTTLTITSIQAQNYRWAHGFGTPNGDSQGTSIATDANGNVYVAGTHADTIDFDPGLDTANIAPGGFIAKYDSTGLFQWAVRTAYNSYSTLSIAVNATGVYATGCFNGTFDFDPSPAVVNLTANWADIFLIKFDLNGNFVWVKQMGGADTDAANSIAIDDLGNSYITGYFEDSADFDPGVGVFNLICDTVTDCFFAKYDMNGNFIWAHDLCDANGSRATGLVIASDNSNNDFYISGSFHGTIDFDRGGGIYNISDTVFSRFIAKYNSSGGFIWAGTISTTGNLGLGIGSIFVNNLISTHDLYVCGFFSGSANFDLVGGILNLTSMGSYDIFLARYSPNGSNLLLKQIGSAAGAEYAGCIQSDFIGNIYLAGNFCPTTDFDPGNGVVNLPVNGSSDMYFSKYDSAGNYLWVKGMGGIYTDVPKAMAIDGLNNQYITGYFTNSIDMDPGPDNAILFPAISENIFIAKYDNSLTNIHSFSPQNNSSNLLVYPNPASSYITLGANLPFQKFNYSIYDLSGRMVLTRKDAMNKTLNISMLSPGAYIINIQTTKQNLYGEFIKLL